MIFEIDKNRKVNFLDKRRRLKNVRKQILLNENITLKTVTT